MVSINKLERALSQAAKDTREEHWKDLAQPDTKAAKQPAQPHEPTQQQRTEHEVTHCPYSVSANSLDGQPRRQNIDKETIPVVEFDFAIGTDRPGDPEMVITVVTNYVNNSCLSLMARRKGAQDEYVVHGMLNNVDRLGLVKAEMKCDQEPSTMEIARHLAS